MKRKPKFTVNRREVLFIILTVIWCGVIFAFSAQVADDSSKTSGGVIYLFCRLVVSGFKNLDSAERDEMISGMQFWVRKAAHFAVFFVLGVLSLQVFLSADPPKRRRDCAFAALAFSILYAISDEVHQHFVPGRACQLRDICIDTAGAAVGVLLSIAVIRLIALKNRKKA